LDELLEYYQIDGVRHLRCPLTTPLHGHPLPAFAQRRGTTTVLHQAATEGQRDVIALLLNDPNCPDIHSKNEEGLKKRIYFNKNINEIVFLKEIHHYMKHVFLDEMMLLKNYYKLVLVGNLLINLDGHLYM
jgi:hypothetical protein